MTKFFLKSSDCDLDPKVLEYKPVQDIVTLNISVRLYQNRSINEGRKAMTKFFFYFEVATVTLTLTLISWNTNVSMILAYFTFVTHKKRGYNKDFF